MYVLNAKHPFMCPAQMHEHSYVHNNAGFLPLCDLCNACCTHRRMIRTSKVSLKPLHWPMCGGLYSIHGMHAAVLGSIVRSSSTVWKAWSANSPRTRHHPLLNFSFPRTTGMHTHHSRIHGALLGEGMRHDMSCLS